jgi:hypothetical protein
VWCRVIWYKVSSVAEEPTAPVFRVEEYSAKYFQPPNRLYDTFQKAVLFTSYFVTENSEFV